MVHGIAAPQLVIFTVGGRGLDGGFPKLDQFEMDGQNMKKLKVPVLADVSASV